MSDNANDVLVTVPKDLVSGCKGIAIDIGSSVIKFIYRSKKDLEESATKEASKYGHLHVVSFPRSEILEALEYVSQRAEISRTGEEPVAVHTTGIGCTTYGKTIGEKLNIKLEQTAEFDCFVKSFFYLATRLPRTELLETFLEDAVVEPLESSRRQVEVLQELKTKGLTQSIGVDTDQILKGLEQAVGRPSVAALQAGDVPLVEADPDMFPCILAMCGSGIGYMKVEKDGSFKLADACTRGGKAFVAIGMFLTGSKSYGELMDLAEKGTNRSVDQFTDDYLESEATDGEDNVYTQVAKFAPMLILSFGKAAGRNIGDLRREDLARAWLTYVILDLVQTSHYVCAQHSVKRLFFCGGFCSHPLVRQLITTEFVRRNLLQISTSATGVQLSFVRNAAHLGALGCLVANTTDKIVGK